MSDKVEINYFSVFRLSPVYLLLILIFGNSVFAHVSLTYPPARKYDLDFLDNIRTKPPCGQPKGNNYPRFTILTNSYLMNRKLKSIDVIFVKEILAQPL